MSADVKNTIAALRFVCGETANVCRLCFGSTDETNQVPIDDALHVDRLYLQEIISFADMLLELEVHLQIIRGYT